MLPDISKVSRRPYWAWTRAGEPVNELLDEMEIAKLGVCDGGNNHPGGEVMGEGSPEGGLISERGDKKAPARWGSTGWGTGAQGCPCARWRFVSRPATKCHDGGDPGG